ncbi:PAS domain-containing protein, partial [Streptomyces sp. NPDC002143]
MITWNSGAEQLLGHLPDDVLGRAAADLLASPLPPSARTSLAEHKEWSGTLVLRHRSGSPVSAVVRAFPQREAHGDVGWVLIA